jgi:hypothetical protein
MIKQITEQLELPLECVYQMALVTGKAVAAAKKAIPHIPGYIQLCLDFTPPKAMGWKQKAKIAAFGLLAGAAVTLAGIGASIWI